MARYRHIAIPLGAVAACTVLVWLVLSLERFRQWLELDPPPPEAAAFSPRAPMPGQIVVDEDNPAWLKYSNGGPFFMCGPGDPEGFLYRGELRPDGTRDGDQMALIDKLKGTGANAIYLIAVRSHGGDGNETENPFVDYDPAKGLDNVVLDQWETWFTAMDENGIVIFFIFYDDSARIWDSGDWVRRDERAFVRGLVERFKHHRHLIWVIGEEYEERYSAQRIHNIAAEIRTVDEFGHPIAVHKLGGIDFSEFADDLFIDQFAIQYDAPSNRRLHEGLVTAWREASERYNLNLAESHPQVGGGELRRRNWATAMAGAYVMALGMDIADTPPSDLDDCGRLVRFMEATNFRDMVPDDELAYAGTQYVLASPGQAYIAYDSTGAPRLGLKAMQVGTYDFSWFNAITGARVEWSNIPVTAGDQVWDKPAGVGPEVAVYIRRSGG